LRFLTNAIKKRCTAFIISDFIVPGFEESLRIASNKHDIVALKVYDPVEQAIPDIGLIKVSDSETGEEKWIDTSNVATRRAYEKYWSDHIEIIKNIFKKCGVDSAELRTDIDYVKPLIMLFEKR
jgi:uncharacterized protein (DUF58 family)